MQFDDPREMLAAMLVTAKWLPQLVRWVEAGVKAMGLTIEKRLSAQCEDGTVEPVLVLRGRHGWELELHLRNAFEDFLLQDREAKPPRLDPRLLDEAYADDKLADVVTGRLAIVETIGGSRTARDVRRALRVATHVGARAVAGRMHVPTCHERIGCSLPQRLRPWPMASALRTNAASQRQQEGEANGASQVPPRRQRFLRLG